MTSWMALWSGQWNAITLARNQDNTKVWSIEDNRLKKNKHLRPFDFFLLFVFLFVFLFTSTLFTEIQTSYQMQPNYKSLVNLPKTLHLQWYGTGRLTHSDLKMCLPNHVSWKRGGCFQRGARRTSTPAGAGTETLAASVNIHVMIGIGPQLANHAWMYLFALLLTSKDNIPLQLL